MIKSMEWACLNGKYFQFFLFIINRSDGRMYKGNWKMGKQHGEGLFYNIETKIWQKGVWDEGKRVRWIQTE